MTPHPKNELRIPPMPTAPFIPHEETPPMLTVVLRHQHSQSAQLDVLAGIYILFPHDGEEQGAGRRHDGDVGQEPGTVVGLEGGGDVEEEGMVRDAAHGVVGDAGGDGAPRPGGVGEEGVEAALASLERRRRLGHERLVERCIGHGRFGTVGWKTCVLKKVMGYGHSHRPSLYKSHQIAKAQSI